MSGISSQLERGFTPASQLWIGAHIRKADGSFGLVTALTIEQKPQVMYNLTVDHAHTFYVGADHLLVHNFCKKVASYYPPDYATNNTVNWSAYFNNEAEARALARQKVGSNPVEISPGKWRSQDGKWQYRAKPGDVSENHVHIEELNPITGEVLRNGHLRWPNGGNR